MSKGKKKKKKHEKASHKHNISQNVENNETKDGKSKSKDGKIADKQIHDDYSLRKSIIGENGNRNINDMLGDGNCLFRSLSDQLFHDYGNRHEQVRSEICTFLEDNEDEFGKFLLMDEDEEEVCKFGYYISEMRKDGTWGGDVEMVCAARLYKRRITVFSMVGAYTIGIGDETPSAPNLLLSFHENSHYNSVHDKSFPNAIESTGDNITVKKDENGSSTSTKDSSTAERKDKSRIPQNSLKQKRNELCACGSGLRYKKCCLAAVKNQLRLAKWKEKYGLEDKENDNQDAVVDRTELEGGFCVLHV